jgi:hypothetical protein
MAVWTLVDIQEKVRDITGMPSEGQLATVDLNKNINNYYTLIMPFELKEQIQLQFIKFETFAGVDTYDFPGNFLTDQPMAYADGYPLIFYQDPDIFYQDWPIQIAADNLGTGDGVTSIFSGGFQSPPIIIGSVTLTDGIQILNDTTDTETSQTIAVGSGVTNYTGTLFAFPILPGSLSITDGVEIFVDNGAGLLTGSMGGTGTINYSNGDWNVTFNTAVIVGVSIVATFQVISQVGILTGNGIGNINYITGAYSVSFDFAPLSGATIYNKYQGYQPTRPQGVLFFNNQFTFRPVPDQVYQIQMQGYINPTELTQLTDTPLLPEWGQLIAYGAALDIFSSRGDLEAYNRYYPILKRFENIALARTVQQFQAEQSVPRF